MKAKRLLVFELALIFVVATVMTALVFPSSYTFHFQQVTLNYYTTGRVDFSTDATGLVRSLGTIAMSTLIFGITTGAAVGLTYSEHVKITDSKLRNREYEDKLAITGLVRIVRTTDSTSYQLTELGRRFLREYGSLDKLEESIV